MKTLVVLLCIYQVLAVPSQADTLFDDLDKLIHSSDTHDDHNPIDDLLTSVEQDEPLSDVDKKILQEFDAKREEKRGHGASFGFCIDGKTFAQGPNQRGCTRRLCYDAFVNKCKALTKTACYSDYNRFRNECPFSCGFCRAYSPKVTCEKNKKFKFGCCFDGYPALGLNMAGCMTCRDLTPSVCKQFVHKKAGCRTGSYRLRTFFDTRCAASCGRCDK